VLGVVLVYFNTLDAKEDSGDPAARKTGPFDGDRAIAYLSSVCDLGSRMSGSEGMTRQQELLQKHFEKHGATVTLQKFDGKQPSRDKAVPMANMIVSWHPKSDRRVIICGHYDTRPIADQEPNFRDWNKPFASANDGTSSVAFMMELAHHMKDLKTEVGVDFVLFDAEEFIHDKNKDKYFLGSEHFAAEYKKAKDGPKYLAGILLDLFAGKGAVYRVEHNTALLAGPLMEDVWKLAAELGVKQFENAWGHEVLDDHIALNKAGIPCIDIIDFDYKHWHRLSDTPDKCSAESMANVAKVIMAWLQRVK
jgi:glutaminyl-peptide cyclotransferase